MTGARWQVTADLVPGHGAADGAAASKQVVVDGGCAVSPSTPACMRRAISLLAAGQPRALGGTLKQAVSRLIDDDSVVLRWLRAVTAPRRHNDPGR